MVISNVLDIVLVEISNRNMSQMLYLVPTTISKINQQFIKVASVSGSYLVYYRWISIDYG